MQNIKHAVFLSLLIFFLVPLPAAFGLENDVILGREDGWRDFVELDNLVLRSGKWGTLDIELQDREYVYDGETDLLMHFNRIPFKDSAGNYAVNQPNPLISEKVSAFGTGASAFASNKNSLVLTPGKNSLFGRGWTDFSIEFWMYPVLLTDGEVVFSWSGTLLTAGRKIQQRLSCALINRKLSWEFSNFFSAGREEKISFSGITGLLPRHWHHHMIRFDSSTGMLEYLVDGVPEAIVYETNTGFDGGSVLMPETSLNGKLTIGNDYTGLIDELRISRAFKEAPLSGRYPNRPGIGVSRIFDLGYTNSRIKNIQATFDTPVNTDIYFYYRLSDIRRYSTKLDTPWIAFLPNEELEGNTRGRYLQLRVELLTDGRRSRSPVLSDLKIVYEPDLPPPPPSSVFVEAGNGTVRLVWKKVNEKDVRGYMVYYGDSPGRYTGTGIEEGNSPIDVGNETSINLKGMENGKLFYFAIVSYDSSDPPHQSRFSMEVSARPSQIL